MIRPSAERVLALSSTKDAEKSPDTIEGVSLVPTIVISISGETDADGELSSLTSSTYVSFKVSPLAKKSKANSPLVPDLKSQSTMEPSGSSAGRELREAEYEFDDERSLKSNISSRA